MAVFYGIGVGPGDPELMTLKAVRIIKECDVIAVPSKEVSDSVAYNIALDAVPELADKEVVGIKMPMTKDPDTLRKAHTEAAETITDILDSGKSIAFLTLGDPTIYSTYTYIEETVCEKGYATEIVNGIASFLFAAARINKTLVERDEMLHVIPSTYGVSDALKLSGTKVFMKAGNMLEEIRQELRQIKENKGIDKKVFFIENCGMEKERIIEDVELIPDKAGYYSMVIVFD